VASAPIGKKAEMGGDTGEDAGGVVRGEISRRARE
jgi:hypothetical protein